MNCVNCGRSWTFFLLRTLLTVIILMFVFWFGVMVGRISSAGFSRSYMMRTGYPTPITNYNPGGPMIPVNGTATTTGY
jgi:hypothetical protein